MPGNRGPSHLPGSLKKIQLVNKPIVEQCYFLNKVLAQLGSKSLRTTSIEMETSVHNLFSKNSGIYCSFFKLGREHVLK